MVSKSIRTLLLIHQAGTHPQAQAWVLKVILPTKVGVDGLIPSVVASQNLVSQNCYFHVSTTGPSPWEHHSYMSPVCLSRSIEVNSVLSQNKLNSKQVTPN